MGSLDAFLKRAARLPRGTGDLRAPVAVLNEATELLPRHAERATEIAMAVSRLGSFEAKSAQRFTAAYQQVLDKRLQSTNGSFSKAQSREALAAYIAIEGLGCGADGADGAAFLASRASAAAEVLEAHELTAALARLASSAQSQSDHTGHLQVALQKGLLNKGQALHALSAQDLCNAVVGLARSPVLLPDAAAAIATAARGRCSELRFRSLLDFSRAIAELMGAAGHQRQQFYECLMETFPLLASEVQRSFQDGKPDTVGLCLSGLVRIAASLPESSEAELSFVTEVISPSAEYILLACQGDDLPFFEVAAPLLQLEGKEAWIKLLRYLALEGVQKLPQSQESTLRLISIMEWVESKGGHVACPPFFDFAVQELSQRIDSATAVRKAAKLLMSVHLERPDLLPASAAAVAKALMTLQPEELPEVALTLSAMAGLYLRVAPLGTPNDGVQEKDEDDRALLARSFEVLSQTAQDLLCATNSQSDAAFLALSAFAQVCRHGDDSDPLRRRMVLSGVQLLDALCQTWASVWNETKTELLPLQQAHIFVTCMRTFCIGKGAPSPPPSTLQVLDVVVQSITAEDHKDARLCLAVLQEIHGDPICPPILKSLLEAQGVTQGVQAKQQGVQGGEPMGEHMSGNARERLRASMASSSGEASQPPQGGFLRRIFGL